MTIPWEKAYDQEPAVWPLCEKIKNILRTLPLLLRAATLHARTYETKNTDGSLKALGRGRCSSDNVVTSQEKERAGIEMYNEPVLPMLSGAVPDTKSSQQMQQKTGTASKE